MRVARDSLDLHGPFGPPVLLVPNDDCKSRDSLDSSRLPVIIIEP